MAFTHAQATVTNFTFTAGATSLSVSLASAPAVGDVVCVIVGFVAAHQTITGVQDGNGNVYTQSPSSPSTVDDTTSGSVATFYWIATGTPSATIIVSCTALISGDFTNMIVDDFGVSGGYAVFDKDAAGHATTPGTTVNTPSVTPTNSGELFYGGCLVAHTATTINSPWTGLIESSETMVGEYILSVSSAQDPNVTQNVSGNWDSMIMAFFIQTAIVGSTSDGVTTGTSVSGLEAAVGASSNGVTTGAVASVIGSYHVSSSNGVTAGFTAGGVKNFAISSTSDGVTAAAISSGRLTAIGTASMSVTVGTAVGAFAQFKGSTSDGVTVGAVASALAQFKGSTSDGVTGSASVGGLGAPFRVTGSDGITGGFSSSGVIVHTGVLTTVDTVTTDMVASSSLVAVAASSNGVTAAMAASGLLTSAHNTTDGVTPSVVAGGALVSGRSTTDGVTVAAQSSGAAVLVGDVAATVTLGVAAGVLGVFSDTVVNTVTLADINIGSIAGQVPGVWTAHPRSLLLTSVEPLIAARPLVSVGDLSIMVPYVQAGRVITMIPTRTGVPYDSIQ